MTHLLSADHIIALLHTLKKPLTTSFFKTGAGHYAAHDIFIGVSVPTLRKVAKHYTLLPLCEINALLTSSINEVRLIALIILVNQYTKADTSTQKTLYQFYMTHTSYINNWNLVDTSAPYIVGAHLLDQSKEPLIQLTQSSNWWERRIAILATLYFIRHRRYEWTFKIAIIFLDDPHDLLHKATGWMLREIGKKDMPLLIKFLDGYAKKMPRTMLRYAIEKFSPEQQKWYRSL